jgi:hypothetical protein
MLTIRSDYNSSVKCLVFVMQMVSVLSEAGTVTLLRRYTSGLKTEIILILLLLLLLLLSYWPKIGLFITHSYLFSRSSFCKFHKG